MNPAYIEKKSRWANWTDTIGLPSKTKTGLLKDSSLKIDLLRAELIACRIAEAAEKVSL